MNFHLNKYILLFVVIFLNHLSAKSISDSNLKNIRYYFYTGIDKEEYLDSLDLYLSRIINDPNNQDYALLIAYRGAGKSVRAVHAFWPITKLNYVKEGLVDLDRAVLKNPNNIEVRFLRFSVLDNLPGILGYSTEANADAKDLFNILTLSPQKKDELLIDVIKYLINSDRLSKAENEKLKTMYVM
jgi:hypothetical protein